MRNVTIPLWQPDEAPVFIEVPALKLHSPCHLESVVSLQPRANISDGSGYSINYVETMKALATAVLLPKMELMNFDGNALKYFLLMSSFENKVEKSTQDFITRLQLPVHMIEKGY